ncbi:acetyltransferase (GNAT) domain protein (macronuclear) [Tetrahymena thermophila SB210]|uniref:Acetyltransferase (GNAT) domain protein n=1 Tax=Tetrahymena thermophila (strain SB210) TaxID=312017 RepID=I7LXN2_TETTS|nr:acetyltransferase (GNAT) domain protein [Tetrahymena thermophila SB210]EAS04971.1 acetyltransferase (GNAT) domain protein [Tetrahymena thermophila SB210]|eukprot:XP_001025216.1 acetyltransferase (GNAT) domain protein [Tetrahymena thermophila SB210]
MSEIKVQFGDVNEKNYELLRTLNSVTFPVQYTLSFYNKVLTYNKYSRLAFYNDILVGAMTCRQEEKDGQQSLYILTIGVLDAYRKHKIGSQLMDELLKLVKQDPEIKFIYLHMQVNNEVGLQFYKRFGFEIAETIDNYYTDISPKACYILKKML